MYFLDNTLLTIVHTNFYTQHSMMNNSYTTQTFINRMICNKCVHFYHTVISRFNYSSLLVGYLLLHSIPIM